MGVLQDNLVLSTGLIMWIVHRKEIRKLTFRALALLSAWLVIAVCQDLTRELPLSMNIVPPKNYFSEERPEIRLLFAGYQRANAHKLQNVPVPYQVPYFELTWAQKHALPTSREGLIRSLADPTLTAFIVCGPLQWVTHSCIFGP